MPTFTDQIGLTIVLPDIPRRIISLVPSQTELLFSLGLDEQVVGIIKFCIHPASWFLGKSKSALKSPSGKDDCLLLVTVPGSL